MPITINGSTGIAGVDGSAGAPAIQGSDSNTGVHFPAADTVAVSTGGSERLRVDSSGNVCIGGTTNVGSAPFGVYVNTATQNGVAFKTTTDGAFGALRALNNAGTETCNIQYDTSNQFIALRTANVERMRITQTGRLYALTSSTDNGVTSAHTQGAGTTYELFQGRHSMTTIAADNGTVSFRVYTNGNVQNTNNSYAGISDVKLKENIVDAGSQWSDLKAIQVRKYNFKEETGHQTHTQIGLVAQEVELISPGLVTESPDRDEEGNDLGTVTKSVNYSVLYMKAVKALQEAMERIETLESEMTAVKAALDAATNQQEVTS